MANASPTPKYISEVPMANELWLNPRETLASLRRSRERLQGRSYHIQDDPVRLQVFRTYLHLLPKAPPRALGEYVCSPDTYTWCS